ncbi:MAG: hypothetical protein HY744_30875 [Deltaproteobacteria bacterium]|nr:hypothetical protein [Deltaproteobacteria bacterium]
MSVLGAKRAVVSGLLLVLGAACGGEPEVPATPVPDGGYPPPPPPPAEPDAGAMVPAYGPCDQLTQVALSTQILARAAAEAPGMKPEGAFACERVPEGKGASVPLFMQPGRCYTILGHSFPNVTEVDLHLLLDPLGGAALPGMAALNPRIAQDADIGAQAAIGRKADCYPYAFPIGAAARVEVVARTGEGPVAVQVFSKNK